MIKDECHIVVPSEEKIGKFVNAFRVLQDTGDELLLDFCVYSQQEQEANVIVRLRIHRDFLPLIRNHLDKAAQQSEIAPVVAKEGLH